MFVKHYQIFLYHIKMHSCALTNGSCFIMLVLRIPIKVLVISLFCTLSNIIMVLDEILVVAKFHLKRATVWREKNRIKHLLLSLYWSVIVTLSKLNIESSDLNGLQQRITTHLTLRIWLQMSKQMNKILGFHEHRHVMALWIGPSMFATLGSFEWRKKHPSRLSTLPILPLIGSFFHRKNSI